MNIGKVIDTFSAKKGQSGLPRPKVENLNLILNYGIENDKFAGDDQSKAIMIVGSYAYDLAKSNEIGLSFGSLGENVLFDFNPHDYDIGTVFKVGETLIQITQNCTVCNHLSVFDDDLPILVQECRGMYCRILKGGDISKGMPVKLVKNWQHEIAS